MCERHGSLLAARPAGGVHHDAAGFASCCGPATCSPPRRDFVTPLRRRPLDRRREPATREPWRLPGPDFHRQAILSLRLGYLISSDRLLSNEVRPESLDAPRTAPRTTHHAPHKCTKVRARAARR